MSSAFENDPALSPRVETSVSVVVPVYNNAATLSELARRIRLALAEDGSRYELILVDDRSTDDSLDAAVELAASDDAIGVLGLARNVGQQQATLIGLGQAAGEWLVVMDADLQDQPEEIPRLLAEARYGHDVVFARRTGRHQPWQRRLSSKLLKGLLGILAGVPSDVGMFMVLNRRAMACIDGHPVSRPWLVGMAALTGLPIATVPVARRERHQGRSGYTPGRRLQSGWSALTLPIRWRRSGRSSARDHREPIAEVVTCVGVCRNRPRGRATS